MLRNILAIATIILTSSIVTILYDEVVSDGGWLDLLVFTLTMYLLTSACIYTFLKMKGNFKCLQENTDTFLLCHATTDPNVGSASNGQAL